MQASGQIVADTMFVTKHWSVMDSILCTGICQKSKTERMIVSNYTSWQMCYTLVVVLRETSLCTITDIVTHSHRVSYKLIHHILSYCASAEFKLILFPRTSLRDLRKSLLPWFSNCWGVWTFPHRKLSHKRPERRGPCRSRRSGVWQRVCWLYDTSRYSFQRRVIVLTSWPQLFQN